MRKRDFRMVLTCIQLGGLEIRVRLPSHPFLAEPFCKLAAARTSSSENPPISVTFLKINVTILTASCKRRVNNLDVRQNSRIILLESCRPRDILRFNDLTSAQQTGICYRYYTYSELIITLFTRQVNGSNSIS